MKHLLFSALILSSALLPTMHTLLAKISYQSQKKCEFIFVLDDRFKTESAALICGKNFSDKEKQKLLMKLSLIHIFVVSGAHILLLESFLSFIGLSAFLTYPLLIFYGFCCGLNPPIVRALIAFELKNFSKANNLNWPPLVIGLLSCLVSLAWLTRSGDYLSLLLSVAAAFALSIGKNRFHQQILIYFFSSLILTGSGLLHPLTIIYNLVLGPIIEFLFVPLAVLARLHFIFADFFYYLLRVFYWLGEVIAQPIGDNRQNSFYEIHILQLFIFVSLMTHFFFYFLQIQKKRKAAK